MVKLFPALALMSFLVVATGAAAQAPDKLSTQAAASQDEQPDEKSERLEVYERLEVKERADAQVGIATSATEGSTSGEDLELRPILRPGDLLETVPGVVITQHSGGGKANQYLAFDRSDSKTCGRAGFDRPVWPHRSGRAWRDPAVFALG
jgi:hypothetical protein